MKILMLISLLISWVTAPAFAGIKCLEFDTPDVYPYIVQKDDTLGGIAVKAADMSTSVEDLICLNQKLGAQVTKNWKGVQPDVGLPMWANYIQPGDVIYLPICPAGRCPPFGRWTLD